MQSSRTPKNNNNLNIILRINKEKKLILNSINSLNNLIKNNPYSIELADDYFENSNVVETPIIKFLDYKNKCIQEKIKDTLFLEIQNFDKKIQEELKKLSGDSEKLEDKLKTNINDNNISQNNRKILQDNLNSLVENKNKINKKIQKYNNLSNCLKEQVKIFFTNTYENERLNKIVENNINPILYKNIKPNFSIYSIIENLTSELSYLFETQNTNTSKDNKKTPVEILKNCILKLYVLKQREVHSFYEIDKNKKELETNLENIEKDLIAILQKTKKPLDLIKSLYRKIQTILEKMIKENNESTAKNLDKIKNQNLIESRRIFNCILDAKKAFYFIVDRIIRAINDVEKITIKVLGNNFENDINQDIELKEIKQNLKKQKKFVYDSLIKIENYSDVEYYTSHDINEKFSENLDENQKVKNTIKSMLYNTTTSNKKIEEKNLEEINLEEYNPYLLNFKNHLLKIIENCYMEKYIKFPILKIYNFLKSLYMSENEKKQIENVIKGLTENVFLKNLENIANNLTKKLLAEINLNELNLEDNIETEKMESYLKDYIEKQIIDKNKDEIKFTINRNTKEKYYYFCKKLQNYLLYIYNYLDYTLHFVLEKDKEKINQNYIENYNKFKKFLEELKSSKTAQIINNEISNDKTIKTNLLKDKNFDTYTTINNDLNKISIYLSNWDNKIKAFFKAVSTVRDKIAKIIETTELENTKMFNNISMTFENQNANYNQHKKNAKFSMKYNKYNNEKKYLSAELTNLLFPTEEEKEQLKIYNKFNLSQQTNLLCISNNLEKIKNNIETINKNTKIINKKTKTQNQYVQYEEYQKIYEDLKKQEEKFKRLIEKFISSNTQKYKNTYLNQIIERLYLTKDKINQVFADCILRFYILELTKQTSDEENIEKSTPLEKISNIINFDHISIEKQQKYIHDYQKEECLEQIKKNLSIIFKGLNQNQIKKLIENLYKNVYKILENTVAKENEKIDKNIEEFEKNVSNIDNENQYNSLENKIKKTKKIFNNLLTNQNIVYLEIKNIINSINKIEEIAKKINKNNKYNENLNIIETEKYLKKIKNDKLTKAKNLNYELYLNETNETNKINEIEEIKKNLEQIKNNAYYKLIQIENLDGDFYFDRTNTIDTINKIRLDKNLFYKITNNIFSKDITDNKKLKELMQSLLQIICNDKIIKKYKVNTGIVMHNFLKEKDLTEDEKKEFVNVIKKTLMIICENIISIANTNIFSIIYDINLSDTLKNKNSTNSLSNYLSDIYKKINDQKIKYELNKNKNYYEKKIKTINNLFDSLYKILDSYICPDLNRALFIISANKKIIENDYFLLCSNYLENNEIGDYIKKDKNLRDIITKTRNYILDTKSSIINILKKLCLETTNSNSKDNNSSSEENAEI